MPRILIAGKLHPDGIAFMRSRPDIVVEEMTRFDTAAFMAQLPAAEALIIRTAKLPAAAVERSPSLRVVSRHGVGHDNIPLEALNARRIPLAVIGDVNTVAVAEHAIFLMLALAKRALEFDQAVRGGDWDIRDRKSNVELSGRGLLILGFGRVGREVATRARSFGLRVLAYDPHVGPQLIARHGVVPIEDWRAVLGQVDIVSLHLPRSAATIGLIGAAELAAMKPGAYLINTARGGLIDEAALAAALAEGRLGGAGLDVLEHEPPPPNHPLLKSERVILSPHAATLTEECLARMSMAAARNALAGIDGTLDPKLVINPEVLGQ